MWYRNGSLLKQKRILFVIGKSKWEKECSCCTNALRVRVHVLIKPAYKKYYYLCTTSLNFSRIKPDNDNGFFCLLHFAKHASIYYLPITWSDYCELARMINYRVAKMFGFVRFGLWLASYSNKAHRNSAPIKTGECWLECAKRYCATNNCETLRWFIIIAVSFIFCTFLGVWRDYKFVPTLSSGTRQMETYVLWDCLFRCWHWTSKNEWLLYFGE